MLKSNAHVLYFVVKHTPKGKGQQNDSCLFQQIPLTSMCPLSDAKSGLTPWKLALFFILKLQLIGSTYTQYAEWSINGQSLLYSVHICFSKSEYHD